MKGRVIDERALLMAERDTVVTALDDLEVGAELPREDDETVVLSEDVPFGHKIAFTPIETGDSVYKYGEVIGKATQDIDPGEWVHTHNCESTRGRGDHAAAAAAGGEEQ